MSGSPSRRALLLGGVGLAVSACGVDLIPGGGSKIGGTFTSAAMNGARRGWTVAFPDGHGADDGLPVVLALHPRDGSHRSAFSSLRLDQDLVALVKAGSPPFAVASVDAGDHSYFHRRADGTDAGAMIRDEFLPLLERNGLDVDRLALFGWSMGGYGAMLLAGRHVLAARGVAVSAPALFTDAGLTAAGAFDSAEDFDRNNVFAHPEWLADIPLRIDCGEQDPFYPAVQDFRRRMRPRPSGGSAPGGHDRDYWRPVAPAQLRFLGSLLT